MKETILVLGATPAGAGGKCGQVWSGGIPRCWVSLSISQTQLEKKGASPSSGLAPI
jgi:hypothetical protein